MVAVGEKRKTGACRFAKEIIQGRPGRGGGEAGGSAHKLHFRLFTPHREAGTLVAAARQGEPEVPRGDG